SPKSKLFPYTTLFRSPDAEDDLIRERVAQGLPLLERHVVLGRRDATGQPEPDILAGDGDPRLNAERRRSRIAKIDVRAEVLVYRSEEHTSELQSRSDL